MPWPGNARELENLIERAVILTRGSVLNVPITEFHTVAAAKPATPVLTTPSLQTVEREHIQRVLRETNGIVSGPRGAAARLGLKRTTLLSRMQHLGISAKEINS
jgi:formate hydrogenlyase transcriptional activator